MTGAPEKPRWVYRFDNYSRAFVLLREGIELLEERGLSQLEREGLIQRFEYTWELGWKTLSDYLADQGVIVTPITPRAVVRHAYEAGIIDNGPEWMAALDARNRMSHTYNFKVFEQVVDQVRTRFLALFDNLYERLMIEALEH